MLLSLCTMQEELMCNSCLPPTRTSNVKREHKHKRGRNVKNAMKDNAV
eukprot:gene9537-6694_t